MVPLAHAKQLSLTSLSTHCCQSLVITSHIRGATASVRALIFTSMSITEGQDRLERCTHRFVSVKNFGLRARVMTTSNRSYHSMPTRWVMPLSLIQSLCTHWYSMYVRSISRLQGILTVLTDMTVLRYNSQCDKRQAARSICW